MYDQSDFIDVDMYILAPLPSHPPTLMVHDCTGYWYNVWPAVPIVSQNDLQYFIR